MFGFFKRIRAASSHGEEPSPKRASNITESPTPQASGLATEADRGTMADLYSTEGGTGMRIIADPEAPTLDIVFVHGLIGSRDKTWTHQNGFFWPDQLAKDIPYARIMTFGYDADVVKLWGQPGSNNIRKHGESLATAASDRRGKHRKRPINFIAHGLGGLVCQQAVLICREDQSNLVKVSESTRGIIFMGTPHGGVGIAGWAYAFAKYFRPFRQVNSDILVELGRDSQQLTAINQQFLKFLGRTDVNIYIYCFFEDKASVGVGKIVPESSAVLGQFQNQSINANHSDMVKFSGEYDGGYQSVLSRVLDIVEYIDAKAAK
ncbi:alpha/beta-Hydrolase [Glarea lozoyensis ATCC 20868]|uniref:Alpha/beta-Hydrolase n=1 Tax=Glarea lozoyensis (strain ATCC 20868 / MF5171) TaxID=1116229 RepID=S3DRQ7_GLAL2|nr:alpha/beta-Hydrolase [Glarea lozoyensis ATCC 20868]EPE34666.1 alpha/beta-Hydrolase [Glarea lozoyensis ATCC 20868]